MALGVLMARKLISEATSANPHLLLRGACLHLRSAPTRCQRVLPVICGAIFQVRIGHGVGSEKFCGHFREGCGSPFVR